MTSAQPFPIVCQGGSGDIGSLGYTDLLNPGLDFSSADYDVRNRFVLAPIWNTPWFNTTSDWKGQALGGWSISGIYILRTGTPFSIYDYGDDSTSTLFRAWSSYPITQWHVAKSPTASGPNSFNGLTVPNSPQLRSGMVDVLYMNPTLGHLRLWPVSATWPPRNAFRGPGASNSMPQLARPSR